jgi:hypothetical protein
VVVRPGELFESEQQISLNGRLKTTHTSVAQPAAAEGDRRVGYCNTCVRRLQRIGTSQHRTTRKADTPKCVQTMGGMEQISVSCTETDGGRSMGVYLLADAAKEIACFVAECDEYFSNLIQFFCSVEPGRVV